MIPDEVLVQKLHPQANNKTCAVACMRSVLDLQYGCDIDEGILEAFGSRVASPIIESGAGTKELRRMVGLASERYNKGSGRWRLRVRKGGTRQQLKDWLAWGCYPMVSMYGTTKVDELHMMLVVGLPPSLIQLFDPDTGVVMDLPWQEFTAEWAEDHWYGVVTDGSV